MISFFISCHLGPVILFRVPITVIVPLECDGASPITFKDLNFKAGTIYRNFLSVPSGAISAHISILSHGNEDGRQFVLHTSYNERGRSHRHTSLRKYVTLQGTRKHDVYINVKERSTLEVIDVVLSNLHWITLCVYVIRSRWPNSGQCRYPRRPVFAWIGVGLMYLHQPCISHVCMSCPPSRAPDLSNGSSGADRILRVDVRSLLKTESVQPSSSLASWALPLMPISEGDLDNQYHPKICIDYNIHLGIIRGLSRRDTLPDQRHTYELILTYKFNQVQDLSF